MIKVLQIISYAKILRLKNTFKGVIGCIFLLINLRKHLSLFSIYPLSEFSLKLALK